MQVGIFTAQKNDRALQLLKPKLRCLGVFRQLIDLCLQQVVCGDTLKAFSGQCGRLRFVSSGSRCALGFIGCSAGPGLGAVTRCACRGLGVVCGNARLFFRCQGGLDGDVCSLTRQSFGIQCFLCSGLGSLYCRPGTSGR